MPSPSQSFNSVNPIPPRVVGINHSLFATPADPVNPFVYTVPTNYNLFMAKTTAPAVDVGGPGDWYIRSLTDSVVIYNKALTWQAFTTITGAASADLTVVYQDIADLQAEDSVLVASIAATNVALAAETANRIVAVNTLSASITSVTATLNTKNRTFVQALAPVATAVGDIWIDTSSGYALKRWDGATWVDTTVASGAIGAAVSVETSARATADGHLEGKYTLTVVAGNVITGMNITSSTGGGTDVSSVIFRASEFKIEDGATGTTPFSVSGGIVYMDSAVVRSQVDITDGVYNQTLITTTGATFGTSGSVHIDGGATSSSITVGTGVAAGLIKLTGFAGSSFLSFGTAGSISNLAICTLASGTAGAPTYSFLADTTAGVFSPGANSVGIAAAGVEVFRFNNLFNKTYVPFVFDTAKVAITTETLQYYVLAYDGATNPIKLAVVA